MKEFDPFFEANKQRWNRRTTVHKDSEFYDLAGFKAGKNSLTPVELNELSNVKDKSLLHLQCHFGMDTLSLARMGARCTGIDLSDDAIKLANELNDELKLDATFICCNVYDTSKYVLEMFDIVFTSYGVIGWLPGLAPWAKVIAERLKPGGFFYIAEFHPVLWMFDDDFTHIKYAYENKEVIVMENEGSYTDRNTVISGKEYSWNHSLSEVLNALLGEGLKIEFFNEYMYSPYPCFRNSVETEPGKWQIAGMEGKIPMLFSLKAIKPG
jgi:2-polyprenyl-3-methyl-5-hydroxy-6-metoxy-1,4-benzoquinol methylase